MNPSKTYVIRRSGTIGTKAPRTRKQFNRRLVENLRDALDRRDIEYELRDDWDRIFVDTEDAQTGEVLRRTFGVQGVRPSDVVRWDSLDELVREGKRRYADRIEGRTFGVFSQRVGRRDHFSCTSVDIDRELGGVLDEAGGEVDLDDPDLEVHLEVHPDRVYFFDEELEGPGGLPIGTEGRALALVSGGFDSIVSAWKMLKRGVTLDFVFFNLAGPPHELGVRDVLGTFADDWIAGCRPEMHLVDFRPLLAELKTDVVDQYWQVVLKRLMLESASRIALEGEASALVTGESIGQVSSQTLPNLAAIETSIELPVLRPLLGENKEDIIERARTIGVHDAAEEVPEFCGLAGGKPVTDTSAERLDAHRGVLETERLVHLTDRRRQLPLREFVESPGRTTSVQIDEIPDEAALLDLRDEGAYESWHPREAVHVPFETAAEQYRMLPRKPTWVLYCEVGLKSAFVAEKMRAAGFDAHSFRGGVPRFRDQIEESQATESETDSDRS